MMPSFLEEGFANVSYGYLSCPAKDLPTYEAVIREHMRVKKIPIFPLEYTHDGKPLGPYVHERGIYAAIKWGLHHPKEWNEGLKPMRFVKRPEVGGGQK